MKKATLIIISLFILIFLIYPVVSWQIFNKQTFLSHKRHCPIGAYIPNQQSYNPIKLQENLFGYIEPGLCAL